MRLICKCISSSVFCIQFQSASKWIVSEDDIRHSRGHMMWQDQSFWMLCLNIMSASCPFVITIGNGWSVSKKKSWYVINVLSCTGCVTPPGTFFQLKMFMLMCLLLHSSDSSEDTKRGQSRNLHLLVIANDLLRIQRLLLYGASFAKRMLVYSPISELFPSFSRDPFGSDTCMVNG